MEFEQVGVIEAVPGSDADGGLGRVTAGEAAVGEFRCVECGYGVVVHRVLPPCPMCGAETWQQSPWSPFSRAMAAGGLR